jgi:hypothetical protein
MDAEETATPLRAPLGELERSLIDEFVRARGHDPRKLGDLPESQRDELLKQASVHASARMAEVESRSHFVHDIHDGRPTLAKTGLE